jgi:hypothetical protein
MQRVGSDAASAPGALRWDNGRGWGLSLGTGGLSGVGLGLAANAQPDASLNGSTDGQPSVASSALPQLTASPLVSFSPAHRFAVLSLPLAGTRNAIGGLWRARLAALRPELPDTLRAAQGRVNLAELSVETPDVALNANLGQLDEHGLLGGYSSPALGLDAAHRTRAFSLSGAWRLSPRWSATASWSQTHTAAPSASGMLMSGSGIRANARGLGLSGRNLLQQDDQFSLAWLQPLKARSGQLNYSVVSGVDDEGQPLYGQQTVNLADGPREWQADVRYQWRSGSASEGTGWAHGLWTAALTLRVHPDHDASAPAQVAGGVRYQLPF